MSRPKTALDSLHPIVAQLLERQDKNEWSNLELSAQTGLPSDKISRFRRGAQLPSLPDLEKMATTFGLELRLVRPRS